MTRMYTDKTDSLKQETPSLGVSFLSVLVVKFVVKILSPQLRKKLSIDDC
jgi:hypothetical protein